MKGPLTADVLDSLRQKAQRVEGFPASLADVMVPAHILSELCDGYAPADKARVDAIEVEAALKRTAQGELALTFGVLLGAADSMRGALDKLIEQQRPTPKPGDVPPNMFAPLDHDAPGGANG